MAFPDLEEPAVSPEVQGYLSDGDDEDPGHPEPSPEVKAYLARLGVTPIKKPGEPITGPSRPKPQHGGEGGGAVFGGGGGFGGHGSSATFESEQPEDTTILGRLKKAISPNPEGGAEMMRDIRRRQKETLEGDQNPNEHMDLGPATFESTGDFAKRVRPSTAVAPPAIRPDVTKVTPAGSIQQKEEALNAPQASKANAARSMRETAEANRTQAETLRAAGKTDEADTLERQASNADKAADALEKTSGPLATMASALGQTLPGIHDRFEHEQRLIREASLPGAVPTPKEQEREGVKHPGPPRAAPSLVSTEGLAELAGQIPAFEMYGGIGGMGGELLGKMTEALGEAAPAIKPVTTALTEGAAKIKAAGEIPVPAGPRTSVIAQPAAWAKDESDRLIASLKPRLVHGLTSGAEGVFGTSYASARSQGANPEDALKTAIESVPANIPFALGMEALGAISGPLARIGRAGAETAGRAAMATASTEATPMVEGMRRVRDAHQIPNIPGARTPLDAPDVIEAREQNRATPQTALDQSPERQLWRVEAQKEHFENAKAYAPNGEPAAQRQAYIVIGTPGAGKGSVVRDIAQKGQALVADADDAKKLSPEYQANPNLAGAVHFETARVNAKAIKQAIKQGLNFVWPTVGANATDLGQRIHELNDAGYQVHLRYVHAPALLSAKRAVDRWRAGQQGFVDPANILALKGVSQSTYRTLAKRSDIASYEEYDNSINGRPPQLVRSSLAPDATEAPSSRGAGGPPVLPAGGAGGDGGVVRQGSGAQPAQAAALAAPGPEADLRVVRRVLGELQPHKVYSEGTKPVSEWAALVYQNSGDQTAAAHVQRLLKDRRDLTLDQVRQIIGPEEAAASPAPAAAPVEPHDDTLVGRLRQMVAEDRARQPKTPVPEGEVHTPAQPITPMGHVELTSENQPGLTGRELDAHSPATRRAGLSLFINRVVRPIVRSEGLPDHVTKGLGSWFANGSLALHEGGTVRFPKDVTIDQVHRVLARVSQAARQNGYFAAIPDAHGTRIAIELDFGRPLAPKELSDAVERLSRADGGRRFNGSTMRDLSPARIQIVLNEGATRADASAVLDLAHQTLAEPGDTGPAGRFRGLAYSATVADGFDPAKFGQVVADRGGLSGSQLRADQSAQRWYKALGVASRTISKARELAHDLHHATAPHTSLALDALGKYGVFLPPLAAAALPGSDDDKAKRVAAASIFLAPRFRRQILATLDKNLTEGRMSSDARETAETWVQRLTTDFGYDERQKTRGVLGYEGQMLSPDEVRAKIEGAKAPDRQVPLVSRLRRWLTQTPADSPRALGKKWDEPTPVADWIGKITSGAAQAGVKKDEIQLLVSALKGSQGRPAMAPELRAFDEVLKDYPNLAGPGWRAGAYDWAYRIQQKLEPPDPSGLGDVEWGKKVGKLEQALGGDGLSLTAGDVRELLAGSPKTALPAKLTRADILKILDEKLPQVERVVLHRGEVEPDLEQDLPVGDSDNVVTLPVVEHTLAHLPLDEREPFIRQQLANRREAKTEALTEIRRHSPSDGVTADDDPDAVIEAHGWDPAVMQDHIDVRKARIEEIGEKMSGAVRDAQDEEYSLQEDKDSRANDLEAFSASGARRALAIFDDGWNGDGFGRDTIDDARQALEEYVDSPDYDPIQLLRDNDYRIKEGGQKWVVTPHEHQGHLFAGHRDGEALESHQLQPVTYLPEEVQDFLADEANQLYREQHGVAPSTQEEKDPEDFDENEITRADVLRLYRSQHGDVPVEISDHPSDGYVITDRKGKVQERRVWRNGATRTEDWRGDDEHQLAYEFISDNDLDQSLRDEQYDEIFRAIDRYASAYEKWREADQRATDMVEARDGEHNGYFADEYDEIKRHDEAIEQFQEAINHPREAPVSAGDRAEKVRAANDRFNRLNDEMDALVKIGKRTREERKRLGSGKHVPEPQGGPHYQGTQVSPGPSKDYRELIPIWANAPVKGREPAQTHMSSHGFHEDIGHVRVSTHLHYEIPGLGPDGFRNLHPDDPQIQLKGDLNERIAARREIQGSLAEITAKLEPFDRIGIEGLTDDQRREASTLARQWQNENSALESSMKWEAAVIQRLAEAMQLKPVEIAIMEENQSDPAQTAASRGVAIGDRRTGVPPNPFMRGGTVEKKGTSRTGGEESRYDVDGEMAYRLNAMTALADAVERDETKFGWQDADTASAVHNFRRKAAKHVYEEVTPSAIRDGLRFAGVPEKDIPKPVHMVIAGAGHWVIELTPAIKAAVKKMGLPIMGLLMMAATARPAKAQSATDETADEGKSNLPAWLATAVGAGVALAALAWARKRKGGIEKYPEQIQDLLDEADSILAKRRAMARRSDSPDPLGEGYKAAFDTADTKSGKGPASYNVGKLGLSAEGETIWRKVVGDPGLKRRISQETGVETARIRALDPDRLLMKDKWDAIDSVAGRVFISEASERLVALQGELEGSTTLSPEERVTKVKTYARLVGDLADISDKATKERQEAGRTLAFYKIATKAIGFDPESWALLARRAKGEPLTSQEISRIVGLLRSQDRLELASYVNGLRPSSLAKRIGEGIRLGMLSSWTTLEKITASHLISELRRVAQHPLAVGLDYLMAAGGAAIHGGSVTDRRTMAIAVKGQMAARAEGARRGLRQARETLKAGTTEEDIGRLDTGRVNFKSPFMRGVQRLIYGMHSLGYAPFREAEFEAVYRELAMVEAKKLHRISPNESVSSIHQRLLTSTPPEMVSRAMEEARRISFAHKSSTLRRIPVEADMLDKAAEEADIAVFQDKDSLLGAIARGARRGAESSGAGAIGSAFIFPFSTIPANIATRLVDSTPAGILTAAIRQMGHPFDQRRLAQDLAYTLSGSTGMLWLGYVLYHKGLISGLAPQDQKQNRREMDEGRQPLSIKLGGNWYSLSDIGPEGMSLALGAAWYQALEEEPSLAKAIGRETGAIGTVIASAPFLSGIREATDAMSDPIRHGEGFIKSMAQALVPASIRRVARAADPTIRETNGPVDQIQSALPGVSQRLPQRLTRFGEPQVRTTGERVAEIVSPVRVRHQSTDPVYQELDRLKVGLPNTRTKVYEEGKSRPTTPDERHAETVATGPMLKRAYEAAIDHPRYADLPDETKKALLEKVGDLPAAAVRYIGNRRADNTAPTDLVERKVQMEVRRAVAEAVQEAGSGVRRLDRATGPSTSIVAPGTPVSPEVAAYLRQQRIDARRRPLIKTP